MPYTSNPHPASDYAEALERIQTLQACDGPDVMPISRSLFLTHGHKVERAILFLHGMTSSPAQFAKLAGLFFASGANVLVPRAPHHGLTDRFTRSLSALTGEGMVRWTEDAVDIAQGLGDRVAVCGLSMGGALAAWVAQNRADVDLAAIMSPALGVLRLPHAANVCLRWLMAGLPEFFVWWDPRLRENRPAPIYSYQRYSTRALSEILRLGQHVIGQARRNGPAPRRVLVVFNPCDKAISNRVAARLVAAWRAAGADNVRTYEFDAAHNLPHDFISPDQVRQKTDVVYPVLLELMGG